MKLPAIKPGAATDIDGIAHTKVHIAAIRRFSHDDLEIATRNPVFRTWPALLDRRQGGIGVDMTGSRAVAQLADRVAPVGIFVFFVRVRLVVIGVASGTIRLERG